MWRLIFSFLTFLNIWQFIYPFLIQFEIRCNILRLKGTVFVKFFNKIKFEIKFRIKNGYIYIYHKNKERKEKISNKNINIVFILNLVKQVYFRHQLLESSVISNFGYINDSMITANISGYVDVLTKCIMSKLKNNKKSAHIFITVNPKYNEDIFNIKFSYIMRMSAVDVIYTLASTIIKTIGTKLKLKLRRVNEES